MFLDMREVRGKLNVIKLVVANIKTIHASLRLKKFVTVTKR